jgi:metal-responsive CopG/Arc/MetJ family transcriptional regulator
MRDAHNQSKTGVRLRMQGRSMGASSATKKVIVEFPADLLQRAELAASQMSTNRSKLIRCAVEVFVSESEKRRIERELAEGYSANDEANRRICKEFAHVDSENL